MITTVASAASGLHAQETITMKGAKSVADCRHDGALRPVVGVQEHALFRPSNSNRAADEALHGHAVVPVMFAHHPFLTFWRGRFWAYYIGFQYDESTKAGYLHWSEDGRQWHQADHAVVFPAPHATHQRVAFYIAENDRLLVSTWFGDHGEAGRGRTGSRLIREVRGPGDFGPIHILKQNAKGGAPGLSYPMVDESKDDGFRAACAQLLADRLFMQQMWEEDQDRSATSPYELWGDEAGGEFDGKAFNWYRVGGPGGRIVGNWKGGWLAMSRGGEWVKDEIIRHQNLSIFAEHRSAKMWGEPRSSGGYVFFYSLGTQGLPWPKPKWGYDSRTPLCAATGEDGFTFTGGPFVVSGDAGPQLYRNGTVDNKTTGPSYVRGIVWIADRQDRKRYNDNVWITYSTNKEVVWVAEVPKEMASVVGEHVNDQFADWTPGARVGDWNIRDGGWTPVQLVSDGSKTVLRLMDKDPYDYAKAFRVFPESRNVVVRTAVKPRQASDGELHLELVDKTGKRPVRLRFGNEGALSRQDAKGEWHALCDYQAGTVSEVEISLDAAAGKWSVNYNGRAMGVEIPVAEMVESVERVEYRTGPWRLDDFSTNWFGKESPGQRETALDGAHEAVAMVEFDILGLRTASGKP